ncbi:MAG TPA: glycoside hydrolase family 3 N-terminal domain-containing protein [Terriglobia bacterium]|nr:glycoside hydrolase family 3 N-terminal domain-containing protein [Terriglobia bacterium]
MKDLSRLALEEKVGQLFFLGFHGVEPDRETRQLLDAIRPGGIVLSRRNIETFDQTTKLTARFTDGRDIPAFVAITQEGGPADRLRQLFAPIPSMSDAANNGMAQLRRLARVIGAELQATGFNTLFGPVLDLGMPGSILRGRTLASSPAATTRCGAAFIEEITDSGTIVCGKHFPGLGAVQRDPHFTLPQVDKSRKLLLMEDIPPFVNLFNCLPMIMVGHAYYPALSEPTPLPASLSPRVVDRLLRKKLGYPGLIITDDMTLGAVTGLGLTPERFLEAFEAGNDMLLFSQTTPLVEQAYHTILRAARQSIAMRNRITASVQRILALKRRIPLPLRNRANARTRILRHIDRLSRSVEVST